MAWIEQLEQRQGELEEKFTLLEKQYEKLEDELDKVRQEKTTQPKDGDLRKALSSQRLTIKCVLQDNKKFIGREILVGGWVRTRREAGSGTFAFLSLFDGTTPDQLQIVVDKCISGFEVALANCAILVKGSVVVSKGRNQSIELEANKIQLVGACDPDKYPLAGKRLPLEHLRLHSHLRLRTQIMGAVMRVRNDLMLAIHDYFQSRHFLNVQTPLIT